MTSSLKPTDISPEKEAYYRKIFNQLDVDKDGRIDVEELKQAYGKMGLLQVPGQAEKFVSASDKNKDGELDAVEFIKYLHEHEMKLRLVFSKLDHDKDGRLTYNEIWDALHSCGIDVTTEEAKKITQRMDKDGTSTIDLDEWVDHHLLQPSADIAELVTFWKHGTSKHSAAKMKLLHVHHQQLGDGRDLDALNHNRYIDIGESLLVPDDFTEEEKVSGLWWRQLVAGGVAGVVSRTCTAPLDRLKVLMQVHATKANQLGIVSGVRSMLREGGVKSFWRGNGINVLKIAPETAIKFMAYENVKKVISGGSTQDLGVLQRFVAGSTAGVVSQTIIYPMEVVKTRLALRKTGQYKGIWDCFYTIFRKEGTKAFFKGYVPNCIGIVPYAGIDLCVYETLKNWWIKRHSSEKEASPSVILLVGCGAVSSSCGQLSSYPLALVRTKLQAQAATSLRDKENVTMKSLFRSVIKSEGFLGLYRGITPNFMKVIPAVSISYVVYENMRMRLGVYR